MTPWIHPRIVPLLLGLGAGTLSMMAATGSGYTLFGAASYVMPGHNSNRAVQLVADVSNANPGDDYSGIDFAVSAGLTFGDLQTLSADYMFTAGTCEGGAPRFQINVLDPNTNTVKNIFAYIGPPPSYTGCLPNLWLNTGNLLAPGNTVDTSQIGGTFYDAVAHAQQQYGSYQVVGIQLVEDTFLPGPHTLIADNVQINDTTYTFEPDSKDACKNGGWKNFTFAPGPFKNQGDCVSYFATGGKNPGNGH